MRTATAAWRLRWSSVRCGPLYLPVWVCDGGEVSCRVPVLLLRDGTSAWLTTTPVCTTPLHRRPLALHPPIQLLRLLRRLLSKCPVCLETTQDPPCQTAVQRLMHSLPKATLHRGQHAKVAKVRQIGHDGRGKVQSMIHRLMSERNETKQANTLLCLENEQLRAKLADAEEKILELQLELELEPQLP
ncbi:uncharacterized protein J3D65DRAFT_268864 [Phyllosticta citribraziliensis]|uniref:Uncharacterized protein n=1 Tax=Phyllosticta citribraziliensis TaxID=989973 RepID=A0ABR1M0Z7_9PEZI